MPFGLVLEMLEGFVFLNVLSICLLGFVTSFTDLRKSLIENRVVFPALAAGVALNFLNGFDLLLFAANGFFAFLFGFILWSARLWSAGDSKLFLAFALLFPLSFYPAGFMFFPAFFILINSFLPAFALLFALVLLRTSLAEKKQALAKTLNFPTVLSLAVFLFSFYWIIFYLFSFFNLEFDFLSSTILVFVLLSLCEFLLPKKSVLVFSLISLVFLAIHFQEIATIGFVSSFLLWLLLSLFAVFFVVRLGAFAFGRKVDIDDLKPGMVLLDSVVEKGGFLKRQESFLPSLVNILFWARQKRLVSSGEAITEAQIRLIRERHPTGKVRFDMLLVQETLPFAVILFAGAIISIFLGQIL